MEDAQLRKDIIDEFAFDPCFDGEHVGVAVDRNVVSLSGHVSSYAEKVASIAAAQRVKGVHAVAENIEVRDPFQKDNSDDQIAKRASDILNWDVRVPKDSVNVLVQQGWVTLSGRVDWHYNKAAAEEDMRNLSGVIGLTNKIKIKHPSVDPSSVKSRI